MSLFIPSLRGLFVLLAVFAVAGICVGLGQLVGARRPAIALVAGWGLASLVMVVAGGTFGMALSLVAVACAIGGLFGLVMVAQGTFEEGTWASTGRVVLLAAPFLLISATIAPAGLDEFAHWLPNLAYIYHHDHFPSVATPGLGSVRASYPYGLAFIGFAASLIVGNLAEYAGIIWSAVLLVAVGCLCADIVGDQLLFRRGEELRRRALDRAEAWGVAGVGLLAATMLNPSFVPRLFLSNYDDGPVGSVTGVVTAATVIWLAAETRKAREARLLLVAAIGFCCTALVSLRQDGLTLFALVFIAAVAATPLERQVGRRVTPAMLLLLLPAPLLVALFWREYQVVQIPDAAISVLPFGAWHWGVLHSMAFSMLSVALAKIGYFALLALLVGFALAVVDAPEIFTPFQRSAVVMASVLGLGKTLTVVVLYLVSDFTDDEVANAHEFWRYGVQVGPALVVGGLTLIPARVWTEQPAGRLLSIAAPALALALPLVSVRYLHPDLSGTSVIPYLRQVAREVAALTPGAARITLVDPEDPAGELANLLPVRYELQSGGHGAGPRVGPVGTAPEVALVSGGPLHHILADSGLVREAKRSYGEDERKRDWLEIVGAPFVWFSNGGQLATEVAGIQLAPGASYLIGHSPGGKTEVLHAWPTPGSR